ncbi:ceramidase domain-containing protein [Roseicyclus mahoneyensis]|uniref:Ceramidase n=1 Tax=Roseicyclus mahoneyensis TaxID=164332 RepID=A0A316G5X7_9RHOB|nr:ceramidase domain-containing protein [Roseicyclus mahoneyensis]PWK56304.1 ceramidase [Roseicyclus mahoneyensis]
MDWTATIDIYCERLSPDFWAEPVNALTNAAFVLAAIWGAVTARRLGVMHPVAWLLIVLAGLIGVGSFLFHTHATVWAALADVAPIWTFVAVFVLAAMRYLMGMPPGRVALVSGLVIAAGVLTATLLNMTGGTDPATAPDPLNGSGQYAPALLALVVFAILTRWRGHPSANWIAAATGVFLMSLTFRTFDRDICEALPLGTHFLWHLLNGLVIGLLLQMFLRTADLPRAR